MKVLVAWTSGKNLSGTCVLDVNSLADVDDALERYRVDYNWRKRPGQAHALDISVKSFLPENVKVVFKNGVITHEV